MKHHFLIKILLIICIFPCIAAEAAPRSFVVAPQILRTNEIATITVDGTGFENRKVKIHYGFNGWNLKFDGSANDLGSPLDRQSYSRDIEMTALSSGNFSAQLKIPAGARAFHFALCWDECGAGQWDNNFGKDYGWPLTFPYIGPILTWNEMTDSATGVVVSFEHTVPVEALLQFRVKGKQTWRQVTDSAKTMHRFVLNGLAAKTVYEYRVILPGSGHQSPIYHFSTLPKNPDDVSFLILGDVQDDGLTGRFSVVANEILRSHMDVDFIISTGDLTWNDYPGDWWTFFDKAREILARKVFMPAIGNHDTPTYNSNFDVSSFAKYFALPGFDSKQTSVSYRVGPASFFSVNSERPDEVLKSGEAQFRHMSEWIRQNDEEEVPWRFAYWHICPLNAGSRHFSQQFQFWPLLDRLVGKVDWIFSGHEHLYQRFFPFGFSNGRVEMRQNYGRHDGEGIGLSAVPSAGATPSTKLVSRTAANGWIRNILAFPKLSTLENDAANEVKPYLGFLRAKVNRSGQMNISTVVQEFKQPADPFKEIDQVNIRR